MTGGQPGVLPARSNMVPPALTLIQPWATLVAARAKRVETRSWRTSYRGWILIHAASRIPRHAAALRHQEPFRTALEEACYPLDRPLPVGVVLAVARLADCVPAVEASEWLDERELAFGDYRPGRWAWLLEEIQSIEPKPCRGALGLWRPPPELVPESGPWSEPWSD